ncbi:MAG: hypothetical protein E7213_05845 [Clostridium sp.]|nr:hypothetical protein [Clostridium sp.]
MKKIKKKRMRLNIILLISSIVMVIFVLCITRLTSSYYHDEERSLFMNNNTFSFNCPQDYKYIHIQLSCESENPIKYSIVNPAGKVVQTAEMLKKSEFFYNSTKGMWKVNFEVNKEVKVNYKLWEGNLKFMDPLEK